MDTLQAWIDETIVSLYEDGLRPMYDSWVVAMLRTLWDLEWCWPNGESRGEFEVDVNDNGVPILKMTVFVNDNDDPGNAEIMPLRVSGPLLDADPREQIRSLIHWYVCHEVDEQIHFGGKRPFYPH